MQELRETSIIHFQGVYQGYEGDPTYNDIEASVKSGTKIILDRIDLSIRPGAFVTVVGPSGCGKSTLLRLVIGQESPLGGDLFFENSPIKTPNLDRAVVYQNYSLFPNLTVLDNVVSSFRLQGIPFLWSIKKREYIDEAMSFLKRAGIENHAKKYPHELSGGQKQRVAIVQSLIQKPKVLCMDEPFSALDPGTREDMQMFLLELWEEIGITVLFVTHDLEEAAYLGTRLIALSQYYNQSEERDYGGAKVVCDHSLNNRGLSPSVKKTPEFGEFLENVRKEAFDPSYLQHVSDFSLNHERSFQAL